MSLVDTFGLDPEQRHAAATLDRDIALAAGAGSGKTRTLVARYLHLLEQGCEPREIAAVTFTEKAAREMRNRIRQQVRAQRDGARQAAAPAERERWANIEADMDAAPIGTIHAQCVAILRSHPAEAVIDPQFEVLDEGLAAVWQAHAVTDALNWAVDQPGLTLLFQGFSTGTLADLLAVWFERRLDVRPLPLADIRQAWNGAILKRLSAFAQLPQVTTAIGELRGLQGKALADDAGAALAAQIEALREQWDSFSARLAAGDAAAAALALFQARREHMSLSPGKRTSDARAALRDLQGAYDASIDPWLGGRGAQDLPPDAAAEDGAARYAEALFTLGENALQRYDAQKRAQGTLDFDDLEGIAARLLDSSEIRARWLAQFKAILVDEFQDTNERQRQIVNALAGFREHMQGRLFVVGDAKQSIYRFRGADVTVFKRLRHDIEARGGLSLALARTYRAHAPLVAALNGILGALLSAQDLTQPFATEFAPLTAHRLEPRAGMRAPFVEFLCGLGASAEEGRPAGAQLLARRLLALRADNVNWDDIALLFRASGGFAAYEDALERAGIPFVTVAGRGFYDRPEIRDLLNILRALANPWDDLAMAGLLRSPAFGLSDAALYLLRWPDGAATQRSFRTALRADLPVLSPADRRQALRARELFEHLAAQVDRVSVSELIKQVLDETSYAAALSMAGTRLARNVEKLLADAHSSGFLRINEFLEYIETLNAAGAREGESPAEAEGAVRLMTVHRAKGLQFPVVVLADASRAAPPQRAPGLISAELGLATRPDRLESVPLAYRLAAADDKARADAEHLRLLYVAATRAEEKLIVCGHQVKNRSGTWLQKLLEAAGSNMADLLAAEQWRTRSLPGGGELIGLLAAAGVEVSEAPPLPAGPPPIYPPLPETLFEKLSVKLPAVGKPDGRDEEAMEEAWRLGSAPDDALHPILLGKLVHHAIRRWCFPGDAHCDTLLQTMALAEGMADPVERMRYVDRARELLARLKADARWSELDGAERHHEASYILPTAERHLETPTIWHEVEGRLDLLCRMSDGGWRIIDFKTDALPATAAAHARARGKYGERVRDYMRAVRQLLDPSVSAEICFLDVAGAALWVPVPPDAKHSAAGRG